MDTELDELLAASAPAGHRRTPATDAALTDLISDTRSAALRARRRRRAGLGAAALSVALIGGAGAAAATGSLGWDPTGWWADPQTTTHQIAEEGGGTCRISYAPRTLRDPAHPVSAEDRKAAMTAAAAFLRGVDETTLVGLTSDEIVVELNDRVTEDLARQGLSTYAVSVGLATDCGTEQ